MYMFPEQLSTAISMARERHTSPATYHHLLPPYTFLMLLQPFPELPMAALPAISPFALGVVGFFVFTLGTSLLRILFHYTLPPTTPPAPSQPPPGVNSNFDSVPPTSVVTTEPPYVGTMTIGGKQNEISRKYIFRGMLDVIEEKVGLSDELEEQTFALSVDLTSDHVDMDNAHSLLDTILRDWVGSRLDRLEQLEILLPPHFKRDKSRTEPLAPPLPKLTHFTWRGNAADMPLPFLHLSYLPLKQITHINLQTALSVADAILILHNCFEIEQAEFHGLSDVPSVLNLRTRPLHVLRHLDTLKVSSTVSLRPLFEAFDMRFLGHLALAVTAKDPENLNLQNLPWEKTMKIVELRGSFNDDMIQTMTEISSSARLKFIYNTQ